MNKDTPKALDAVSEFDVAAVMNQLSASPSSVEAFKRILATSTQQAAKSAAASDLPKPAVHAWADISEHFLREDHYTADQMRQQFNAGREFESERLAAKSAAPAAVAEENAVLRKALQFYADGGHFMLHQPDAWDTVSGEPGNFQEDESCTATVEDGTVAKMALKGTPLPDEDDAAPMPAGAAVGLRIEQEPKYTVNGHAIVNRASGEEIPADEPVFIFRARDAKALAALYPYHAVVADNKEHMAAVWARILDFRTFALTKPERMKEPDTTGGASTPTGGAG